MLVDTSTLFEAKGTIMSMYIDTAKTFIQLATSLLAITILFREKVLHEINKIRVTVPLASCWIVLLLSIGAGALYQYRAVKYLDRFSPSPGSITVFDRLVKLDVLYAVMLITFFLGALLFVVAAWQGLASSHAQDGQESAEKSLASRDAAAAGQSAAAD